MSMKKLTILALAAAMAAGTLASCGTYTDSSNPVEDSSEPSSSAESSAVSEEESSVPSDETPTQFTIIATQPNTLNMIQSASNLDSYAFYLTQEMLFRPHEGVYEPEVVDTWEVDETNTVYTYHLKETNWSDGTPITAEDFAYFLTSRLDPANGSSNAATLIDTYHFVNAAAYNNGECDVSEVGIQALDAYTLQLTLEQPVADFDGTNITVYPLDADFVAAQGEALGGTVDNYMNSGPYILKEWVYDSYLTYEKNPDWLYADEQFAVDTIRMVQATDANTSVSMFEGGEVDAILQVSKDYLDTLSDSLVYTPSSAFRAVQLNTYGQGDEAKAALLSNGNFRNALSYALDRDAINAAVNPVDSSATRFMEYPVEGSTPGSSFAEEYAVKTVSASGDAEAAVAYLQAAMDELGYASVDELPELSYLTFENDTYRLMAEVLVDQWNQVLGLSNITIDLKPIPDAIGSMMSYQYDLYYTSLSNGTSPSTLMNYWITGGAVNDVTGQGMSLFSNAEFDELVKAASVELDRPTRMGLYAQAEQIMIDEAPLIPINTAGGYSAVADYVEGYVVADSLLEFRDLKINK